MAIDHYINTLYVVASRWITDILSTLCEFPVDFCFFFFVYYSDVINFFKNKSVGRWAAQP